MLSPAHRRSIHTSLAPILGEEETEALMSEFPASAAERPVTIAHFDATIAELRHEMQLGFASHERTMQLGLASHDKSMQLGLANLDKKIEETMKDAFRTMVYVMASALVGGMGLSAAIAAGIAQAMGGG